MLEINLLKDWYYLTCINHTETLPSLLRSGVFLPFCPPEGIIAQADGACERLGLIDVTEQNPNRPGRTF